MVSFSMKRRRRNELFVATASAYAGELGAAALATFAVHAAYLSVVARALLLLLVHAAVPHVAPTTAASTAAALMTRDARRLAVHTVAVLATYTVLWHYGLLQQQQQQQPPASTFLWMFICAAAVAARRRTDDNEKAATLCLAAGAMHAVASALDGIVADPLQLLLAWRRVPFTVYFAPLLWFVDLWPSAQPTAAPTVDKAAPMRASEADTQQQQKARPRVPDAGPIVARLVQDSRGVVRRGVSQATLVEHHYMQHARDDR
jgi:hypothetical protein